MTRILLAAYGSRGDVQPMVALGKGLQAAGYDVTVAAAVNFGQWIEASGLAFEPFSENMEEVVNSDLGKIWLSNSSQNPRTELTNFRRMAEASAPYIAADLLRMADKADLFISGMMTIGSLDAITRTKGQRHMTAWLSPMIPTRSGAAGVQAPLPSSTSPLNRWFGYMVEGFLWTVFAEVINLTRKHLGLSPATRSEFIRILNQTPSLGAFSPLVVPPPPDWGAQHHITGYWFDSAPVSWTPPKALADFLAAGDAPVYIGFGSMSNNDPAGTTKTLIEALQKAGKRGILHSGWAGLHTQTLPESIYGLDFAPHDWLFPQMAAVIHHGGAGTTAAALRAGVPSMIVAHMGDQPYWGRRVHELGVGARPIRRHQLSVDQLAAGIVEMTSNAEMRRRAAELGQKIASENGVTNAVRVISDYITAADKK